MGNNENIKLRENFRGNGLEPRKEDRSPDLALALKWRTGYAHSFYGATSH